MVSDPQAEIRPLLKATYALGVTALVILAVGLGEFLYFEPLGETTGTQARVRGIYAYDSDRQAVTGADSGKFGHGQSFAAVVEWESLPPDLMVCARWYNGLGVQVGGVEPSPAGRLVGTPPVPVEPATGQKTNIPGEYLFVVERIARGQPVEVLARRLVLVTRA